MGQPDGERRVETGHVHLLSRDFVSGGIQYEEQVCSGFDLMEHKGSVVLDTGSRWNLR